MYCQQCGAPTEMRIADGRERPVCTVCGRVTFLDPKLAVTVVVGRDDAVLLGKRAAWTRSAGRWSFPAGFVDRGEAVETAARREVREEAGLEIELDELLGVYSADGEATVLLAYAAVPVTDGPVAGDDLVEIGWFGLDALPDLAFPHDADILVRWRSWRAMRALS